MTAVPERRRDDASVAEPGSDESGAIRWTYLLSKQRGFTSEQAASPRGMADFGLGRRLASNGDAHGGNSTEDPWEVALHRRVRPGLAPTLVALRETAENATDNSHLTELMEQRKRTIRAGDEETIAASVRVLPDSGFRELVGELFRREGYEVLAGDGPDADVIDFEVRRANKRFLLNCQLRGVGVVGTAPLIEMAKVLRESEASGAFMVADAEFSPEADLYARGSGLILIDRPLLNGMVTELALEDARRPTLARRISKALHPEQGCELRHLALRFRDHR